jgi:hypothetical protein
MPTAQSSNVNASKVDKKIERVAAAVVAGTGASSDEQQQQQQQQQTGASTHQGVGGVKTPPEQPEFIKQALIIIEKKVRNLEKRKVRS